MSYYKVKSIRVNKDKISVSMADSNVRPTTYYTSVFESDKEGIAGNITSALDEELRDLCKGLCTGDLQPNNNAFLSINLPSFKSKNDTNFMMMVIHKMRNSIENMDLVNYYKLKDVDSKFVDMVYEKFFKDWITKGEYSPSIVRDAIKDFNVYLNDLIDKAKETMDKNDEARINSCGKCEGLTYLSGWDDKEHHYLIGISDIDEKMYLFMDENYDKESLGLIHNISDAIELKYDELNSNKFHILTSIDDIIRIYTDRLQTNVPKDNIKDGYLTYFNNIKALYLDIKSKSDSKDLSMQIDNIIEKVGTLTNSLKTGIPLQTIDNDDKEIDNEEIER